MTKFLIHFGSFLSIFNPRWSILILFLHCAIEICDSAIIIRSGTTGVIHQRWWYDQILNISLDEGRGHVYIWRKSENSDKDDAGRGSRVAQFFCQTRCGELYRSVLSNWNRTAARLSQISSTSSNNSTVENRSGPVSPKNGHTIELGKELLNLNLRNCFTTF